MDADELRSLQAPLKERYREDAGAALIVLKASGAVDDSEIACSVDTGKALVEAGLHPSGGGTGLQACSGDMLLQALVACAGAEVNEPVCALDEVKVVLYQDDAVARVHQSMKDAHEVGAVLEGQAGSRFVEYVERLSSGPLRELGR